VGEGDDAQQGSLKVTPLKFPKATASFHQHACGKVIRDIKRSFGAVAKDEAFDRGMSIPPYSYELPDGNIIEVGVERFTMLEPLFNLDVALEDDICADFKFSGLPDMIQASIAACNIDIRKDLASSIVMVGGNVLYDGFGQRIVKSFASTSYKARVHQQSANERTFSTWVGGSILSSLGSFHQMWFSKQEYEEHGPGLMDAKCP
jgi:actin-like protein 6A